ncbi:MAG: glycosyltransferase family 4 protein [Pseudomonadota bacterium]
MTRIAFAIPGDIDTPTGGYRYDRALMAALSAAGHTLTHIPLAATFPAPSEADVAQALAALSAADADALLVDGLAYAVLPANRLAALTTPLVALVHHPLALETGLAASDVARLTRAETAALTAAHHVVVTSAPTAQTLVEGFGVAREAITIAVPGIDPLWFDVENSPTAPPTLVSVGSLTPRKGHDTLLAAMADVDPRVRLDLFGSGAFDPPHAARLEALAGPLGDRVRLRGAAPEPTLAKAYAGATAFVLATHYEGFGMVFAEALAAGLPVIGTTGGAVPSVVPPEAGILVPPGDAMALTKAITAVVADPARRNAMAAAARPAAQKFGTWADTAATVARTIEGCLP